MNKNENVYVMEFKGRIHGSADTITLRTFDTYEKAQEYVKKHQSVKTVKYWTNVQIVIANQEVDIMSMSPDPNNPDILYEH